MRSIAKADLPPLRVVCDGEEFAPEDSEPAATLTLDGYTALRVTVGRRSRAQLLALDWSGTDDPEPWFDRIVGFSIARQDIHDAH